MLHETTNIAYDHKLDEISYFSIHQFMTKCSFNLELDRLFGFNFAINERISVANQQLLGK